MVSPHETGRFRYPAGMKAAAALMGSMILACASAASAQTSSTDVREALRRHDYESARAIALVVPWDLTTEAGRADATETWLAFLAETHRRAMAHHRAGRGEEARDLAAALLAQPPLHTAPANAPFDASHYQLCQTYCELETPQRTPTVLAPTDRRTTQRLEDLALFLMIGELGELSRQLLTQIVSRNPDRHTAVLNLGDLQWADAHYELAMETYERLRRLRGERVPARVTERLRSGPPSEQRGPRWARHDTNDGVEHRLSGRLGEVGGAAVSFRAWRREAGWGYWESSVTLIRESNGARAAQRLSHGSGSFVRSVWLDGDAVVVRYTASGGHGGEDSTATERWTWDATEGRFRQTGTRWRAGPYQSGRARQRAALTQGDMEGARGAILEGGTSAGMIEDDADIFAEFVGAAYRLAQRHVRGSRPARAAELCRLAIRATPVYRETLIREARATAAFARCAHLWGEGPSPRDRPEAIAELRAFARRMTPEPEGYGTPEIDLAFADALHALGAPDAAAPIYQRYVRDAEAPVPRARERAGP